MEWEYKVEPWNRAITTADAHRLNDILNDQGRLGWELVNVVPQLRGDNGEIEPEFNHIIFKRRKD